MTPSIQHWLALYGRGELISEEAEAAVLVEYQANNAALDHKVGQLTMELELLKKTPAQRFVNNNESTCIIIGPTAYPFAKGVR